MNTYLTLALYCVAVVAASLFGGALPMRLRLSHRNMNLVMALVAGVILGIGVFHMLPHGVVAAGNLDRCLWAMMLGMLVMFLVTRTFHGHHHPVKPHENAPTELADDLHQTHQHPERQNHGWLGLAAGMSLHSLFDGVALAASVTDPHEADSSTWLVGMGAFAAIAMHKPLDAMSVTSLIRRSGGSPRLAQLVNIGFAMIVPIGAALFMLGAVALEDHAGALIGLTLAFSAGVFLSIALGDLLPELHFHPRDRLRLSSALIVGVLLAHFIGFLEPAHLHDHGTGIHGHGHGHGHGHAQETAAPTNESLDDHHDHDGHDHDHDGHDHDHHDHEH